MAFKGHNRRFVVAVVGEDLGLSVAHQVRHNPNSSSNTESSSAKLQPKSSQTTTLLLGWIYI